MRHARGDNAQPVFTRNTLRSLRVAWEFFSEWIRIVWFDILTTVVLGGAALGIYFSPVSATRNFPVTFAGTGDIVYPQFAYPYRGWIVETWVAGLLSTLIPIAVILLAQFRVRSFWDVNNGVTGLMFSLTLASFIQVVVKQLIGGFRPYFLDVCMPDLSRASANNATGLNAVGFQQIMYTVDICTQPDRMKLKDAMTSFPSGHSTAAFAAYVFLFLYLNAKLKVWADYRPALWKIVLTFAPLFGALLIACSLTINQAHNWYDIIVGSAIGTAVAFASYRGSYAAVWDWRFNHVPLEKREQFVYLPEDGTGHRHLVFTRSGGWGKAKQEVSDKSALSGRSSDTYFAQRTSYHGAADRESQPLQSMGSMGTRYKHRRDSLHIDHMV
ncbi:PA-phosphatase related-family protein [Colletotrichum spinosum]|uniref:PA-phosphatase related-family protein n=1 Tax=Colletotrichum spinosum TaxID=1347390 RepID=A0A4R8PN22_9PEZI|nr:PA-phosphatase related-family protein [Colletotrichum spinosum]